MIWPYSVPISRKICIMTSLSIQEVLAANKKLQEENEKLKRNNDGVHVLSQAFAESKNEQEKLKGTIRILTQQLSSTSSSSLGTRNTDDSHPHSIDSESGIADDTLLGLAGQLGTNWRSLAFRLDVQTSEVDAVQEQYSTPKEQIYRILLLWRQKQDKSTDYRAKLASALERTGRKDLAEMLQKSSSEKVSVPSTCDLPWFVDVVSLECQGENEWKKIGQKLLDVVATISIFAMITELPPAERMYGVLSSWLQGLKGDVNPVHLLVTALKNSGRPDVAEKLLKASKARNEYVEDWSMRQKDSLSSGKLDTQPRSTSEQNDTLNGIASLKNSSIHSADVDTDLYKHDSVKSFATNESVHLTSPEPVSLDAKGGQEEHTSLSLQIKDIEKICRTQFGSSELTKGLAKMLPKSVEQDKELKQLRTLRVATMDQNQRFKDEINEKNHIVDDLRLEVNLLKKELEETKRVKQDENLRSFEIVTKGDAHALKREEKLDVEKQQGAGFPDVKPRDTALIGDLRKENSSLKKQIDEILKVNNEWDQHYAGMKSSFEAKLKKVEEDNLKVKEDLDRKMKDSLLRMAADNQKESNMDKKQREFDQMLTQAKARIDTVEAEKDEHQKRSARLEKWVHMLLTQKTQNEEEIGRLNGELENSMQQPAREFEIPRGAAAAYGVPQRMNIPRGRDGDVDQRMQEQLELLQQQNMAFQSDFNQERRDRQQVVSNLADAQEELTNLRKIAMDLQEQVNNYEDQRVKRPPGYKSYYGGRRRMIHRGVNYGGNDVYIDANDVEVDGVDGDEPSNADSECPVCERVITDKKDLERHVERCTNNFD